MSGDGVRVDCRTEVGRRALGKPLGFGWRQAGPRRDHSEVLKREIQLKEHLNLIQFGENGTLKFLKLRDLHVRFPGGLLWLPWCSKSAHPGRRRLEAGHRKLKVFQSRFTQAEVVLYTPIVRTSSVLAPQRACYGTLSKGLADDVFVRLWTSLGQR